MAEKRKKVNDREEQTEVKTGREGRTESKYSERKNDARAEWPNFGWATSSAFCWRNWENPCQTRQLYAGRDLGI
jgi:hypothetical protein